MKYLKRENLVRMTRIHYLLIVVCFFTINIQSLYSQNSDEIVVGQKYTYQSEVLSGERSYYVSLPESYNDPLNSYKKYPILIILDGETHFKSVSGVVQFMSTGFDNNFQIPEMIVVAIISRDRHRDYTPDKGKAVHDNRAGGGDNFLYFLEKELIPELDKKYRTESFRLFVGHSLGGLLTTHAYLKKNTIFNAFIAIDPALNTWDEETMKTKVDAVSDVSFNRPYYIASANSGNGKVRNEHQKFFTALKEKNNDRFLSEIEFFEKEDHASVPLIALYHGLQSIFEGYKYPIYSDSESVNDVIQYYEKISKRLSFQFLPPERVIEAIGYRMLYNEDKNSREKSLAFFKLNKENYPYSYRAFNNLGEAQEILGNKKQAIENYKKSLELNPNNENIKKAIENLSK